MRADAAKPLFKTAQLADLFPDLRDTGVGDLLEIAALEGRLLPHGEEFAGFLHAETEIAEPANEQQPPRLGFGIAPLASLGALRFWHQADALIIADGIDLAPSQAGKFADPEARPERFHLPP
jgi:hypothetical protein